MSVWPPDDVDVLDLDDLERGGPGPVRSPLQPGLSSPQKDSWNSLTDPRFFVPLLLFLSAMFVIGMAVRAGSNDENADGQPQITVQSELALSVRDAELRAGFDGLTIIEKDGTVIIEGEARDPLVAASIGAVARSVEGTQRVDNRVVVAGGAVQAATGPGADVSQAPGNTGEQLATVGHITFETGSASLTPEGSMVVDSVATILARAPGLRVEVHGHTDSDGDDIRNQVLSQERAEAVTVALEQRGINIVRLTAVGFGESKPIEPNITAEGRAVNRRIEFLVVG
jgi:outer membrane protein OmpA-like peptidoglycan-associated protein